MRYPEARPAGAFQFEHILYQKDGYKATVTINRPQALNAINFGVLTELSQAFQDASWDDRIAVVVLTGAGDRAFCTGADLKEQERFLERPRDYWKWMGAFIEAHERLRNMGKPTIARLNGMVVGGGNEFNMSCDLAVMVDTAHIRQVGTARGSVAAAGATQWLPIMVGDRRAREVLWLCEEIPARTALEWGLVNRVVPREQLDATVDAMAEKLYHKLPECMRYTRTQANFWKDFSWHVTVQHAREWLTLHAGAPETYEGMESFYGKRLPDYGAIRSALGQGGSTEYFGGAYDKECPHCHAKHLHRDYRFCGHCGGNLT